MVRVLLTAIVLGVGGFLGAVFAARHGVALPHAAEGLAVGLTGAGAVILLWEVDIAWTFALTLAFTMFSGYTSQFHLPIGPDRLLFALGVLRLLWDNHRTARPLGTWRPIHWLLLLALADVLLSAVWAGSLTSRTGLYALLDRFGVVPFLVYAFAGRIFGNPHQRRILLGVLVVVGLYLGVTALLETLHLNALVWPHYITDPSVGIQEGRARGPFAESVADGLAMFACGVAATIAALQWRGLARLLAASTFLFCGLGIVLTLTRAVWLGSAVAVLLTLLAFRELRRYFIPAAVASTVGVALALVLIPGLAGNVQSRASSQSPVWDRLNTDAAALRMLVDHPLVGVGWTEFPTKSVPYFRQAATYPITGVGIEVHNVFLSRAVELGIIGVSLWLAAFVVALGGALLQRPPPELVLWRIGLFAVAVQWIIVASFGPLSYAFANMLLWLWAGVVAEGRVARRTSPAVAPPAVAASPALA